MLGMSIYIATIVAHNPSQASELLGYQHLIHSASKHFGTSAWLKYDVQFRTLAASNPQLWWDLWHSELWLENLAFQNSSYSPKDHWPCTYCGSTYHFPDCCPFHTVQQHNDDTPQWVSGLVIIVEQDHLHVETSITPPAIVIHAITNITVTSVVPQSPCT